MSEDHAVFPGPLAPPILRARDYLERRGQQLPVAALRILAREVILRVSRAGTHIERRTNLSLRSEIDLLCDALLSRDETAAADLVHQARLGGMPTDTLYHLYIAGAVCQFGDRWERDEATAAQVIIAAGRVYSILRELRAVFISESLRAPRGAEAVFATVPGEVHGLGVMIAADTLRRKGWDIALRVGLEHEELVEEIASLKPSMVGLSVSMQSRILPAARLIVALRMRCPQVWIILGGTIVADDPEVANAVDADAGARDIEEGAALLAGHLDYLNGLFR
ncbi:cobalamin B12-binding domain-containing protein [Tabrizicola caldifontis]|uniref:cobalamin B12-binding domain-containing protein n=1 Tax=Tabrizicola caldifontis TaxID=2528036 RepID=UPI001081B745|nr:cobalamin-dependent protein [Rhodobacter sp. YIM 73028]